MPHTNTQIHITDHPSQQPLQSPSYLLPSEQGPEDGLTLADIPQFIEASQNKSLPHSSGRQYIAGLPPQDLLLIKYAALLIIAKSPLGDPALVEEMIEFLEAKKGGFWNKLFNKEKKVKKQGQLFSPPRYSTNLISLGVFCVPLELLAEREGVDSMLGATSIPLRVPSFIDDIVSAMKQMGKLLRSRQWYTGISQYK
jgi:hypothetical protein